MFDCCASKLANVCLRILGCLDLGSLLNTNFGRQSSLSQVWRVDNFSSETKHKFLDSLTSLSDSCILEVKKETECCQNLDPLIFSP